LWGNPIWAFIASSAFGHFRDRQGSNAPGATSRSDALTATVDVSDRLTRVAV
jgi:hypothetical protein